MVFDNSTTIGESVVIDDVSITAGTVCFRGDSLILVKNIITEEISEMPADHVESDKHLVYSVTKKSFMSIIYNIVSGPQTRFMYIEKDKIALNQPSKDLYITSGHRILSNNKEIKASDVPNAIKIVTEPVLVYTICTKEHDIILVNGIGVASYGDDEWQKYAAEKNFIWKNNGSQ